MRYQYVPLSIQTGDPSGLFAIRLLHVLPSTDSNSVVQCQLVETLIPDYRRSSTVEVESHMHVEYHALSYSWGEQRFPQQIQILDGSQDVGEIYITENLHSALQNLRLPDGEQILWVDALSINQSDITERNSQVSNMPQTYSEAVDVLVWLGAESSINDGSLCLNFLANLAGQISTQIVEPLYSDDSEDSDDNGRWPSFSKKREINDGTWRHRLKIYEMVASFLNSSNSHVVPAFLSRTWFRRRWIVQEVVLAQDVKIYCGTASILWVTFQTALTELYNHHSGGFDQAHCTTLRTMSRIRDTNSGAKVQTPLDTLVEFSEFLCSDPRDRLYALYGVIQHWLPASTTSENQPGAVDYSLSVGEVFTNFAILMMHLNQSNAKDKEYNSHTHVLQLAAALKHGICHKEQPQLQNRSDIVPSWVPDWTGTLCYKPLKHSPPDRDASRNLEARPIEILTFGNGSKVLLATGLMHDIVTASIPIDIKALLECSDDAKKEINRFLSAVDEQCYKNDYFRDIRYNNSYHLSDEHFITALTTTLVANWEHTPENSYFAQNPRFAEDFLEELELSNFFLPEILHKWPAYVDIIAETMKGRTFFLTRKGYMGIGNESVQANDIVCVLGGTRIPFILRPHNGRIASLKGRAVVVDGCHEFEGDDKQANYIQDITENPSSYCMFQLMGDAYIHHIMDGEGIWPFDCPDWSVRTWLSNIPIM